MNSRNIFHVLPAIICLAVVTFGLAVSAQAQTETIVFTFTGTTTGQNPGAGLVADAAGNLYGVTPYGGKAGRYCANSFGCGFVYELSPNGSGGYAQTILYNFTGGTDGDFPVGNLIFDAAGNLYGVTNSGGYRNKVCEGGNGCGVVYKLSPGSSGWTETVLYTFMNAGDGEEPYGPLTFDGAGNLYGTTEFGGSTACEATQGNPCGLVFELTPTTGGSWTESVLYTFNGGNGGFNPNGSVTLDAAGNVYGSASGGNPALCRYPGSCGVLFELSKGSSGWAEKVLHTFSGGHDGGEPSNHLVFDGAGDLYGTSQVGGDATCTVYGATNNCGVVFKLTPAVGGAWKETSFAFSLWDGAAPQAGVTVDASGNVYGTATAGGLISCSQASGNGCGVVFKLMPNSSGGWTPNILHRFTGGSDGYNPTSTLLFDSAGNIFGPAVLGGADDDGVVYEIVP
jgi:hypothetical protein